MIIPCQGPLPCKGMAVTLLGPDWGRTRVLAPPQPRVAVLLLQPPTPPTLGTSAKPLTARTC